MIYKFSAPMPFTIEDINKILDINTKVIKSKITSLYACVPSYCELFTGFEQPRNFVFNHIDWNYWKKLIKYVLENNCDFIYLLNNPNPIYIEEKSEKIKKLDKLLIELSTIGVNKLRVASLQLSSYLANRYPHFQIFASTSLDYKTISEYKNFLKAHYEIKQIIPSHDVIKNLKLLRNIKCLYPNIEIELMVNEGCMKGCPHRLIHEIYPSSTKKEKNQIIYFSPAYFSNGFCSYMANEYPFETLTLNNNIYPWEIEEYSKLGINNFKLVGRDWMSFDSNNTNKYLDMFEKYLLAIENYKAVENVPINVFIHHISESKIINELLTKEVRSLLPNMNYFKKYGHLCTSRCGVECRYCYKCAEKIQKVFEYKMRKKENLPHYVPSCKIERTT